MGFRGVWGDYSRRVRGLAGRPGVRLLLENFASLSAVQLLSYLFPLLATPYLIRVLGAERYGLTASAISFAGLFAYLTNYGFGATAARQISVHRHDLKRISEVSSAILTIKGVLLLFGLVLFSCIVALMPNLHIEAGLYLLVFGVTIGDTLYPQWLFQGLEKLKLISALNVTGKAITFALIILLISQPKDYLIYAATLSASQIVVGLIGISAAWHTGIRLVKPDWNALAEQLREGWLPFLSAVSIGFYTQSRLFIFGLFSTNTLLGYYAFADKAAGIAQVFPISVLITAVLPRLTFMYSRDPERARELFRRFHRITFLYIIIVFPVLAWFANEIIVLLSGHNYPESVISFRILLAGVFFALANSFRVALLVAAGRFSTFTFVYAVGSAIGLSMMIVLTIHFSFLGMAVSAAFTEAFIFALTSWKMRTEFPLIS